MSLLKTIDIVKKFGGVTALNGVSVELKEGEFTGLIGPNGSGKTTFINVVSGIFKPDFGKVLFMNNDITNVPAHERCKLGITRTFQIPQPFASLSVWDNVLLAAEYCKGSVDEEFLRSIIKDLGLYDKVNESVEKLSLVEKRLLELARAVAAKPRLLLVDEVLVGLREAEIKRITSTLSYLNNEGITILWVEHRVHDLIKVVKRLIVFNFGKVIADGDPEKVVREREVIEAYLGRMI